VSESRWLTHEEQAAWRAFLSATHLLMARIDHELQRDAGISHAYYAILAILSEQPDRAIRMTRLAERLQYSKSRLSHGVERLEDQGWVQRVASPTDRRGASARLTDDGFAALAAAAPVHVGSVRRHLFARLTTAQVEQLRAIGEAVAAPLSADR
jgi:DNA-binding MarR family transcriptional regulator